MGNKKELNCKRHCKLNRRVSSVAFLPATDDHPRWQEGQKYVERPA